jgi:hypothetical protein
MLTARGLSGNFRARQTARSNDQSTRGSRVAGTKTGAKRQAATPASKAVPAKLPVTKPKSNGGRPAAPAKSTAAKARAPKRPAVQQAAAAERAAPKKPKAATTAASNGRAPATPAGPTAAAAAKRGATRTTTRATTRPARAAKRGSAKKGARRVPPKPPAPVIRVVKVKQLDPFAKCGPGTSVEQLFRVDEDTNGHATVHLVFLDRHGWYCVHGPRCAAVADVHSHNKSQHRARAGGR